MDRRVAVWAGQACKFEYALIHLLIWVSYCRCLWSKIQSRSKLIFFNFFSTTTTKTIEIDGIMQKEICVCTEPITVKREYSHSIIYVEGTQFWESAIKHFIYPFVSIFQQNKQLAVTGGRIGDFWTVAILCWWLSKQEPIGLAGQMQIK